MTVILSIYAVDDREARMNGERKRRLLFLAKRAEKLLGKLIIYLPNMLSLAVAEWLMRY